MTLRRAAVYGAFAALPACRAGTPASGLQTNLRVATGCGFADIRIEPASLRSLGSSYVTGPAQVISICTNTLIDAMPVRGRPALYRPGGRRGHGPRAPAPA